jgi:hypothetical protein
MLRHPFSRLSLRVSPAALFVHVVVFRCPNVLSRCNPLITALGQFLGESFKQMTTSATAQLLDT